MIGEEARPFALAALLALLASGSPACVRTPAIEVSAPPEVSWIAVLSVGAGDRLERASGILPWDGDTTVFTEESRDALIAGWSEADLRAIGALDLPPGDLASPLVEAVGCAPPIGSPRWLGRWAAGSEDVEVLAPSAAPSLTADWLGRLCPGPDRSGVWLDVGCRDARCTPRETRTGPCALELDLGACGLGRYHAQIRRDGSLCLAAADGSSECSRAGALAGGGSTFSCQGREELCAIDAHPRPAAAWAETRSARLFELPERFDPPTWGTAQLRNLHPRSLMAGYAFDLVALEDRVVVAAAGASTPVRVDCSEAEHPVTRLFMLDPESLAPIATATAGACLRRMVAHPAGGFVGAFREGGRPVLGRFDPSGRLIQQSAIDDRMIRADGEPRLAIPEMKVLDLQVSAGALQRLRALLGFGEGVPYLNDGGALIFEYDLETLRVTNRLDLPAGDPWSMVEVGTSTLALGDTRNLRVRWIDLASGAEVGALDLPRPLNHISGDYRDSLLDVLWIGGSRRLLAGVTSKPAVRVVADRELAASGVSFERSQDPARFHRWPPSPRDRALVAGGAQDEESRQWTASAALFDVARGRYLPGSIALGAGVVSRIREDRRGRLWLLLPWAAEVVRLEPLTPPL